MTVEEFYALARAVVAHLGETPDYRPFPYRAT